MEVLGNMQWQVIDGSVQRCYYRRTREGSRGGSWKGEREIKLPGGRVSEWMTHLNYIGILPETRMWTSEHKVNSSEHFLERASITPSVINLAVMGQGSSR